MFELPSSLLSGPLPPLEGLFVGPLPRVFDDWSAGIMFCGLESEGNCTTGGRVLSFGTGTGVFFVMVTVIVPGTGARVGVRRGAPSVLVIVGF